MGDNTAKKHQENATQSEQYSVAQRTQARPRSVSKMLGIGIFFMPYVFAWFTLRDGYSLKARSISLMWMALIILGLTSGKNQDQKFKTISAPKTPAVNSQTVIPHNDIQTAAVDKNTLPSLPKKIDPALLVGLHKSEDKMEKVTFYSHPKYISDISRGSAFSIYMGVGRSRPWLRIFVNYKADDWLFIQNYKLMIDGIKYDLDLPVETKVGYGGSVYEWSDELVEGNTEKVIRAVATSKEATIRYVGRQFYRDRKISKAEKQALDKILKAYDSAQ